MESLHYIIRNPQRTIAEGLSAAACKLHERIEELDEQGIPTAAIHFQDDVFFPLETTKQASENFFDIHHVYESENSNHLTPQADPAGVSRAIRRVLRDLHEDQPLSLAA
jgi:pimeloyl-ACP methyl ester carboxylesterase